MITRFLNRRDLMFMEAFKSSPIKKTLLLLVLIAGSAVAWCGRAEAQGLYPTKVFPAGKENSLSGAISLDHFDYKEKLDPPLKSEERGWVPGFHAELCRQGASPSLFVRAAFDFTRANTTYDGSTQDSLGNISPYLGTTQNTLLNASGVIGLTFLSLSNPPRVLTAYTGIGYRYWERTVAGTYQEHYAWRYAPVGLRADYRLSSEFSGAVDASARIMFGGTIDVFLSELSNGWSDLHLTLGNRPGFRVEAPLYYQHWIVTPWYEYSAIGQSNTERIYFQDGTPTRYEGYEPTSTTHQFGVNIGARITF